MRFTLFRTPKAKKFNFPSRYYDPQRDEWERRKAELGYDSRLSKEEQMRVQMSKRWERNSAKPSGSSRILSYSIYAIVILGGIYVIFFTRLIENFLTLFGMTGK